MKNIFTYSRKTNSKKNTTNYIANYHVLIFIFFRGTKTKSWYIYMDQKIFNPILFDELEVEKKGWFNLMRRDY